MDSCVPMSYVIAALGLIVVAQSAALVALAGARQRACRRADEHARRQAEADALAHDFNNLLAVILNYSSFVLGDLGRDDPRRGDVAEISRAAKQAGALSHALLVLTRGAQASGADGPQDAPARPRQAPPKRRVVA
jgi:signal transduction histidine kinase